MTTYYYMRISTKEESDKQSFKRQEKALERYAKENNLLYKDRYIYKDDTTGSTFNRSEWLELEGNLQSGDTIVFKEISRFTREAENGYKKYMELMEKGVNLLFLDNPTVSTDYISNLSSVAEKQSRVTKKALENTIELLLIVELDRVEQERLTLIQRVKQGIEASSKKSGRKFGQVDKLSDELRKDIIDLYQNKMISKNALAKKHKISRNTLNKYIEIVENDCN